MAKTAIRPAFISLEYFTLYQIIICKYTTF